MNIIIPKLLQDGLAKKINDELLNTRSSFAFLDISPRPIRSPKSTYYDAFFQYSVLLYKLYHDSGMYFLQSFVQISNKIYNSHINAVYAFRTALVHTDDGTLAFKNLKNYYFKHWNNFTYNDWDDFLLNATDSHWEHLTKKIVRDSDQLYDKLLCRASIKNPEDPDTDDFCKKITSIFKTGSFKDYKSEDVFLYDKSFDSRFLKRICSILKNNTDLFAPDNYWGIYAIPFYKQKENDDVSKNMKTKIITKLKNMLFEDGFSDSNQLFNYIKQCVEEEIKDQIQQNNANDAKIIFDD